MPLKRASPEDLRLRLEADNIEARPLWKPMHLQPVFNNTPYYGTKYQKNFRRACVYHRDLT